MNTLDCEQVLRQVWTFLDGELDDAQSREIQAHIAECADCGPRFEFQRRLLALIEQKAKERPISEHLKQRLFKLLEAEPGD